MIIFKKYINLKKLQIIVFLTIFLIKLIQIYIYIYIYILMNKIILKLLLEQNIILTSSYPLIFRSFLMMYSKRCLFKINFFNGFFLPF